MHQQSPTILLQKLIIYLLLGPCLGLLLFGSMVTGRIPNLYAFKNPDLVLGAYVLGIVPALISLVLVEVVRRRGSGRRCVLAWTPAIGAISIVLPIIAIQLLMQASPRSWREVGTLIAVGLLACPICEALTLAVARRNSS